MSDELQNLDKLLDLLTAEYQPAEDIAHELVSAGVFADVDSAWELIRTASKRGEIDAATAYDAKTVIIRLKGMYYA